MIKKIEKVAIIGGTHGNELTGVYLINSFKNNPSLVKRDSFKTILLHSNLKAIEKCIRYIDKDLNRTFSINDLNNPDLSSYEDILAKNLNQILGPKGAKETNVDFIIDLHSTTSNMGLSIVIDNDDELTWQIAAHLKVIEPRVNIFRWKGDKNDASFIDSVAKRGIAIEVGAIPQGVLRADLFFDTKKLILHILDFIEKINQQGFEKTYASVEIYDHIKLVDFPRDKKGNIIAMVHPSLQDNDYKKITKADPIFITLEGDEICYEQEDEVYALFINEAAYYEKGFAMCLAQKKVIEI